jgi:hypothetical protein
MRVPALHLAVTFVFLLGCSSDEPAQDDDDVGRAQSAVEATEGSSVESALLTTLVNGTGDAAPTATTGVELAGLAGDSVTVAALCSLGGSASATITSNTVSFEFVNCSNHCGLLTATGTVDVTYDVLSPSSVHVALSTANFHANEIDLDIDLAADYSWTGTGSSMAITTDAQAEGPLGGVVGRTGTYSASFDEAALCISQSGEWTTTIGIFGYTTTIDNYRRCAASCPDVGSKLRLTNRLKTWYIDIEYTAVDTVSWETGGGLQGEITLPLCRL